MDTHSAANRGVKATLKRIIKSAGTSSAAAAAKDLQSLCELISPIHRPVAPTGPDVEASLRSALDGGVVDALAHHHLAQRLP